MSEGDVTRRGFLRGIGAMAGLLTLGAKQALPGIIEAPAEVAKWIAEPEYNRIARWFQPQEILAVQLDDPEPVLAPDGTQLYRRARTWGVVFRDPLVGKELEEGDLLVLRIGSRQPPPGEIIRPMSLEAQLAKKPVPSKAPAGLAWEGLAKITKMIESDPVGNLAVRTFHAVGLEPLRRVSGVQW